MTPQAASRRVAVRSLAEPDPIEGMAPPRILTFLCSNPYTALAIHTDTVRLGVALRYLLVPFMRLGLGTPGVSV